MEKALSLGESLLDVVKSTKYWNGVVRYTLLPPIKAMAASSAVTWDDSLVSAAESFLDRLLPLDK